MSANITDYFNKASNMNGSYPAVATVTAARSTGGSTLSCDDLSSWATDTPVHFSTFKVNTDGSIDATTQTDWKGIVNGNTITDMTRLAGAADSGNASGDRVELNPTIGWLDDLVTGLLVAHKQNGALKDNAVTESSISTGAVTNTKLGDSSVTTAKLDSGAVTSAKIATGAINSYDKIGDDVIQARNINFASLNPVRLVGATTGAWKDLPTTRVDLFSRVTITEAGKYLVIARAFVDISSHASYISICKNTSILTNASENTTGQHSLVSATVEEFDVGDLVYLQGKTDGSGKYYDSRDRLEFVCVRIG